MTMTEEWSRQKSEREEEEEEEEGQEREKREEKTKCKTKNDSRYNQVTGAGVLGQHAGLGWGGFGDECLGAKGPGLAWPGERCAGRANETRCCRLGSSTDGAWAPLENTAGERGLEGLGCHVPSYGTLGNGVQKGNTAWGGPADEAGGHPFLAGRSTRAGVTCGQACLSPVHYSQKWAVQWTVAPIRLSVRSTEYYDVYLLVDGVQSTEYGAL